MNTVTIPVQEDKLEAIKAHSSNVVLQAQDLQIQNEIDFASAKEFYLLIADSDKQGKTWMKAVVNPFKKAVKNAENMIKPFLTPYAEAKTIVKEKLEAYIAKVNEENRKKAEEERKAREAENALRKAEAEKTGSNVELIAPKPVQKVDHSSRTSIGGVHTRKVMDFEVIDWAKLPDDFKLVNEKKLREHAKAGVAVPGVRFFEKETVVARTS